VKVRELIEDLKQAPEDSEICFIGNGMWAIAGIEIGKRSDSPVGYVMLRSSKTPYKHLPVRKIE
jgi:hypothetical protein